jgi:hypothetical protein
LTQEGLQEPASLHASAWHWFQDKGFSNRAASIKIVGDCAWVVFELKNYRGFHLTLMPGSYDSLPDMHRRISSLKKTSAQPESSLSEEASLNLVAR